MRLFGVFLTPVFFFVIQWLIDLGWGGATVENGDREGHPPVMVDGQERDRDPPDAE